MYDIIFIYFFEIVLFEALILPRVVIELDWDYLVKTKLLFFAIVFADMCGSRYVNDSDISLNWDLDHIILFIVPINVLKTYC